MANTGYSFVVQFGCEACAGCGQVVVWRKNRREFAPCGECEGAGISQKMISIAEVRRCLGLDTPKEG